MIESATFDPVRFKTMEEQEGWFAELTRTLAVDYDGVLHPYTAGWVGSVPADEPPMPGAQEFLEYYHGRGWRIVVFSTRCDHPEGLAGTRAWLEANGLMPFIADVTHEKPAAIAYVDDRAVPSKGDWDAVRQGISELGGSVLKNGCPSCGHFACICNILKDHAEPCLYRRAATIPIGIACDHGRDVCPECDPCTCEVGFMTETRLADGTAKS